MQSTDLTLDQLASQMFSISSAGGNLWRESNIEHFSKQSLVKNVLCGRTTALINTYFGNTYDPLVQHIGEQLLERYSNADDYLVKLHTAISTTIEMNRSIIAEEKNKIKKVVDNRARLAQYSHQGRSQNLEASVLIRINLLPEDIVNHIKEYLPQTILLAAISIPTHQIYAHFSQLKLKSIKGVYVCIRKNISTINSKMYRLAHREIIRYDDLAIFNTNQPRLSKPQIISRIHDICYCYNLILNIVSKIQNNSSIAYVLCNEMSILLTKELTYIYKLMKFVATPQNNGRAKPKPRSKSQSKSQSNSQSNPNSAADSCQNISLN
jgi:hypothetical protein